MTPNPGEKTPRELFEENVQRTIPLGREQTPDDIGNLACLPSFRVRDEHHRAGDKRQRRPAHELIGETLRSCYTGLCCNIANL